MNIHFYLKQSLKKIIPLKWKNKISYLINSLAKERTKLKKKEENLYKSFEKIQSKATKKGLYSSLELVKILDQNNIYYSILSDEWWKSYMESSRSFDSDRELEKQKELIKDIKNIKISSLKFKSYRDFLHLYTLSIQVGLLNIAYAFRLKALEIATSDKVKKSRSDELAYFAALIETRKDLDFLNNLSQTKYLKKYEKKEIKNYCTLIFKENINSSNSNYLLSPNNKKNQDFSSYVKMKNISIIGPALIGNNCFKEIQSCDIIIRCNYKENGKGIVALKNHEAQCDICYLNGMTTQFVYDQKYLDWPSDIKWVMCKNIEPDNLLKRIYSFKSTEVISLKARALKPVNNLLFNGSLNMIPDICLDILQFHPHTIKIYQSDFMLTPHRLEKYNVANLDTIQNQLQTLTHDPITQFTLMKKLREKNKIIGDKRFEEVIKMSTENFMNKLQKIYGNYGRFGNSYPLK